MAVKIETTKNPTKNSNNKITETVMTLTDNLLMPETLITYYLSLFRRGSF